MNETQAAVDYCVDLYERKLKKLAAEHDRLRKVVEDFAEADCTYGDNCPTSGSRHGQCFGCKAREALAEALPTR